MIKGIVYTSNTGYTAQYAALLGEKTGLPVCSLKEARRALPEGSEIIYLGWLMAGNVKGWQKASKRYQARALAGVGLGKTGSQLDAVAKRNALPEALPLFTLQGGFDMEKLKGVYRLLMKLMMKGLEKKADRTPGEEEMLVLLTQGGSHVSEENLKDLLEWYQNA